ncbi:hypothetical protein IWX83_003357 [Flavobacterium sp. CG_9.1]|uniref:hypothetical protein n=1 Tax=Flavobacterium sp. CG_9.1 TaxID=2787728 RepID=UPI0018CB1C7B|nr:hypothetical protein [Flavobacterium sp. CG_9.1]MBG6063547.1 hypothetical protein [Flavobacterium sp. CG_9.1]
MKQPKIHTIKSSDTSDITEQISEAYWQNVEGLFTYRVDELAKRFELSAKEISAIAANNKSYIDFGQCKSCGSKNITKIENRTRANQVLENLFYYFYCETCRKSANDFCKKLDDKQTKIVWMRLCYKYQLWEELNKDEMNFLKAIYYLKTWNRIYHEIIKLDLDYSFKILFKLDKIHLIYYIKDELTGQVEIKMLENLKNLIKNKSI